MFCELKDDSFRSVLFIVTPWYIDMCSLTGTGFQWYLCSALGLFNGSSVFHGALKRVPIGGISGSRTSAELSLNSFNSIDSGALWGFANAQVYSQNGASYQCICIQS